MSLSNIDNSRLASVLANWQEMPFKEQPILIKTFTNGLNNQAHLISSNKQQTVLKLFTKANSIAIKAQKLAANHQLAPNILYANKENDVALMEYVNIVVISEQLRPQDIMSLGKALKTLHSIVDQNLTKQIGGFNLIEFYTQYLSKIGSNNNLVNTTHKQLEPIVDVFLNNETSWCICHNDLVKENCFISGGETQFIDWEYCQLNNPWFDLVTLIYSLKLDQSQTQLLITSYQPNWLQEVGSAFYFAALSAMLWCDILWFLAHDDNINSPDLNKKLSDLQIFIEHFNQTR